MTQEELSRDEIILREREILDAQVGGLLLEVILPAVLRVVAAHNALTCSEAKAWLNDNDTAVKIKKLFSDKSQGRNYTAEMAIRFGSQPYSLVANGNREDTKGIVMIGKATIRANQHKNLKFVTDGMRDVFSTIQLVDLWVTSAFLDQVHDR